MLEFLNYDSIFEIAGTATGLLAVWLLIKQNIWTWPLGLAYALVSLVVFYDARLYADLGLHVFFFGMNAYGWYYWSIRGPEGDPLEVSTTPRRSMVLLGAISIGATVILGYLLDTQTDADLAYWDSTTTILSLVAMWMTARKLIESWWLWLFIDVLLVGIYYYKGIHGYALLYGVYLVMAVMGFRAWRATMTQRPSYA